MNKVTEELLLIFDLQNRSSQHNNPPTGRHMRKLLALIVIFIFSFFINNYWSILPPGGRWVAYTNATIM